MARTVRRGAKGSVYVGRPTIYGNPFIVDKHGDRAEVIGMYREWFAARVVEDYHFRAEVLKLRGRDLACYCSPMPCHADVIREWLDAQVGS